MRRFQTVAIDLPGPSRRITVEPIKVPAPVPPPKPAPERSPKRMPGQQPDRDPEPVR